MAVDFIPNISNNYTQNAVHNPVVRSSEDRFSSRAKKYLEELRQEHKDIDFIVADPGDDKEALAKSGTKEIPAYGTCP